MLSHKLRKYRFDKVFDFQNNRKSHVLSFLSFPKESYGYDNGKWGWLLTHPIRQSGSHPGAVEHQFQILKMVGIPYARNTYLELWPSLNDRQYVQGLLDSEWLGNSKNIVGINIAASAKWESKNWPVEHIARLCDLLAAKNMRVLVTGVEKDRELARDLVSKTKSKPAILIGKTDILQLAALMERCRVFVTMDSAPLHVAAAMRTPVIALFGPTDPQRHAPPAEKMVILKKELSCAPCYSPRCPILTHVCMKEITPEDVLGHIESLLGAKW